MYMVLPRKKRWSETTIIPFKFISTLEYHALCVINVNCGWSKSFVESLCSRLQTASCGNGNAEICGRKIFDGVRNHEI